ncbi:MAG: SpoIIE family protein phosphatase [Deltaproteobacteria bacterium]|nr:SpoIIE family protein phosphatase [Deltaproteobacteria bacterium]
MTTHDRRILIIDDDPGVREAYDQILSAEPVSDIMSRGIELFAGQDFNIPARPDGQYDITLTDCGEAGVAAVKESVGSRRPFAAAFVDMMMPGIDGAETARQIWQIDADIKIVIVTAYSDYTPDDIVNLVGREDLFYLRKPFNPAEIRQFARALTNQWELEREKEVLAAKLARAREQEITTAARIQQTLLLGRPPQDFSGIEIHHKTIPSQKVDGDFIDFIRLDDTTLDIIVGDVMGKGVPAALMGAALKSQLLRALNDLMRAEGSAKNPKPEDIVSAVQADMIQQFEDLETFVTLCYARFDMAQQMIRFVDCGHMRTIHLDKNSGAYRLLEGVNMPLGFPEKGAFTQISVPFNPGDVFIFYSDGLTEARNRQAEMYGEQRLADFVQQHADSNPRELIQNIWQDVVDFAQSDIFSDDFTCIGVRIMDIGKTEAVHTLEEILDIQSDLNELARVREFAGSFCTRAAPEFLDRSRIDLIELAVNEAVVNVIKHAYSDASDKPVRLEARRFPGQIVFRLYDWGQPFDPAAVPPPTFDGSKDHGFGVYIIEQAVDEIEYTRDENGRNCATMRINLRGGKRHAV